MALTITIEGTGVIANADAYPTDSAGGTWGESGGGTVGFNPDVYLYGAGSIGSKYASKSGYTYYNTATALDFSVAGAVEGQYIYIWINIQSVSPFLTLANNGFSIRVGTSLTDYRDFIIAGKDDGNGWTGGWKCFVIDPTKTGSVTDTGTYDLSSINYIGLWIDTDVSVRADSIFIDQISVGSGLRITGTSTTAWLDTVNYCTDYTNRAWGMFEEREGIYYAKGMMYAGDSTQTAITSFADSGRVIKFETSEYWSGTAWVSTVPIDAFGIVVEDATSFTTTFSDGVLVGDDNGRSGSTFIGNSNEDISVDFYGGNNAGSITTMYGSKLQSIYGSIASGDDADHKFYGVTFVDSSQFDPVGAPVIRNCTFAETVDIDSALLWNESINILKSSFIANTLGAAIEMPSAVGTPYTYTTLSFSGNTFDVLNSSGSAITINNSSSNASTYEGSAVTFISNPVTTLITVKALSTGNVIVGAKVYLVCNSGGPENHQASITITRVTDTATVAHTAHGYSTGELVLIEGADDEEYNGVKTITVTGVDAYTYTVVGTPITPATGTILATTVIFHEVTDSLGQVSDSRALTSDQPVSGWVRMSTSAPYYKTSYLSGPIDSDNGLLINIQMVLDQ